MFEKAKGFKICKTIHDFFFGPLEFLLVDEKRYLVSHCHVKIFAVVFVIFFPKKNYIFCLLIFIQNAKNLVVLIFIQNAKNL